MTDELNKLCKILPKPTVQNTKIINKIKYSVLFILHLVYILLLLCIYNLITNIKILNYSGNFSSIFLIKTFKVWLACLLQKTRNQHKRLTIE